MELTIVCDWPRELARVRCHTTQLFHPDELRTVLGILTTSPARTVVDLAGELDRRLLERIVDAALRRSLCSPEELRLAFNYLAGRGRRGTATLRRLLRDRLMSDSPLEARWLHILRRAGLRPPATQHQVAVGQRVFLLDFAWPEQRVGVEVDGWEAHCQRSAWDKDHDKANACLEAGWRVVFVTSNTATGDVVRQLRTFISE